MKQAHKTTSKEAKRTPYERKDFERKTTSAPAWAWGCSKCKFGAPDGNPAGYCDCPAGQARQRWATGASVQVEDDYPMPTFNGVRL
jgi:hypothetical protein